MKKKERFFKVINRQNGGIYLIGEVKLRKEPTEWDMFIGEEKAPIKKEIVIPEDEAVAERVVEVHPEDEDGEITYQELKEILTSRGVDFKGNASKDTLEKLLDES